ncbi:MAG: hypothetical protein MUO73_05205, partial [Thermoplasmata archaeon]|nr:hypothetical protein [Thermoplasmata archaeon]
MSDERDEQNKKEDTKESSPGQSSATDGFSSDRLGTTQKAVCQQIIKSVWTHEPWLFFKVVVKSNEEMSDYIA